MFATQDLYSPIRTGSCSASAISGVLVIPTKFKPNVSAECALDPATRILRRLTIEDAKAAKRTASLFETLMGSDVAKRRDYLVDNSSLLDPEALDI